MASRKRARKARGTAKKPRRISLRELAALERRIERERARGFRAPKGWAPPKEVPVYKTAKRRERIITSSDVVRVANFTGDPNEAVSMARRAHFHPDEWAVDLGAEFEDYDLSVHDIYSSYFDSPPTKL